MIVIETTASPLTLLTVGLTMGWLQIALLAAAAAAKYLKARKDAQKQKEALLSQDKSLRAKHDVSEKSRIAALNFLANGAKANGFSDIQVSPEMLAPRPYTGPDPVLPSQAGVAFDAIGDAAGSAASYAANDQAQKEGDQKWRTWMCLAYPNAPGCNGNQGGVGPMPGQPGGVGGPTPTPSPLDYGSGH